MIRSILVAMDGSPHAEAASALAIRWGQRFGAALIGLGILDEPSITRPEPVSIGAMSFKHERDTTRLAHAHQRILEFLDGFSDRCANAGVRCDVVEDVGTPHEQIVREAERCDVVILGRESNFHFETQDRGDRTLSLVLRHSPRPVVVVPNAPTPGRGVLVAYGGGREIARTLQSFALLDLAADETVDLIAIHEDRAEADRRLQRAEAYLAAHAIRHRCHPVVTDAPADEVILAEIRRRQPGLVVMGRHGHQPVRDLFVTPVTRAVVQEASAPVFTGA